MKCRRILAALVAVLMTSSMMVTPVSATGWVKSDNSLYYQLDSGKYATGWMIIGNYKYYFGSNGKAATGLKKIGDDKYCFDSSGRLVHGVAIVKDTAYIFGYDGKLYNTMKKTAFENLKARSPEPNFVSTEPIQYSSKGTNQGYVNTSFYANLDANFYRLFGYPSTKASVINNMGDDDKYITYMLYAYMDNYCVPADTYKSWKDEARAYLKSLKTYTNKYGETVYGATGRYKGVLLRDLHLVQPMALLSAVDTTLYLRKSAVDFSKIEGSLNHFTDDHYDSVIRNVLDKGSISDDLLAIEADLYYDLKSNADYGTKYTKGQLECKLDVNINDKAQDSPDDIVCTVKVNRGTTDYEMYITFNPISGKKSIEVRRSQADNQYEVKQFKTLAEAEEYIWG